MMDSTRLDVETNWSDMVDDYDKTSKIALKGKIGADIAKNILGTFITKLICHANP